MPEDNENDIINDDCKKIPPSNESEIDDLSKIPTDASECNNDIKKEDTSDINDNNAKTLRRKLKKQRQKERKKKEKSDVKESENEIVEVSKDKNDIPVAPCSDNKTKIVQQDDLNESKDTSNDEGDDQSEDFDFVNNVPAFFSASLTKTNKALLHTKLDKSSNKKPVLIDCKSGQSKECDPIYNDCVEHQDDSENEEFTCVKSKRLRNGIHCQQLSEACAIKGITLIMQNMIPTAVKQFSEAIQINPSQLEHYVNRSFCYLRTKQYPSAIADAQHAIENCKDGEILLKAKYILAQAFCNTLNFENAEKALEECLSLSPHDMYLKRELLRVKISQLTNFGFPEKDVIHALKDRKVVMDALELLLENSIPNVTDTDQRQKYTYDQNDVYHSDEDEDNSSNTLLVSSLTNSFHLQYNLTGTGAIRKTNK